MRKNTLFLMLLSFLLVSCYPEEPKYYEDLDLVFSDYDENFSFHSYGTYAIPDSIVIITGNLLEGEPPEFVKQPYASQILETIEKNMNAYGWQKVDDAEDADLVLLPATWTNTSIYYWYDYWCWWDYYYCGWGYYPYYTYATSYTTGTLVMALISNSDDYIEPTRVWTGAVNGLLSGSFELKRVKNGVDQAFVQSPYLNIN